MRIRVLIRSTVLCLVGLVVVLLNAAPPAAALLGGTPTIIVNRTGNALESFTVSEISVNRGIAVAAENADFSIVVSAQFLSGGDPAAVVVPCGIQITPDKDAEISRGGDVPLVPHTHVFEELVVKAIEEKLNLGESLTLEVTLDLILTDADGGVHVLDSVTASGTVNPMQD